MAHDAIDSQTLDIVASNLTVAFYLQAGVGSAADNEGERRHAAREQRQPELAGVEDEVIAKFLQIRHRLRHEMVQQGRTAGP